VVGTVDVVHGGPSADRSHRSFISALIVVAGDRIDGAVRSGGDRQVVAAPPQECRGDEPGDEQSQAGTLNQLRSQVSGVAQPQSFF
jgi:hypothetical protein